MHTIPIENKFFTDVQVAAMLGLNPVTVRKWRAKNKKLGLIKYGPPYEFRGPNVVYPKDRFSTWCSQVQMVGGVPRVNLPISATIPLPDPEGITRPALGADVVAVSGDQLIVMEFKRTPAQEVGNVS